MPIKVLIVDDDPLSCEFIQEVLISEKMQARVLTDSTQAAARLKVERFDAVFLDMRMPSPDGIELASQMRSSGLNKTTPIVMITGEEDHTVMRSAFQVGVNFFLHKPADRTRLMRLLRAADNGTTLDLSLGGMFVRASSRFPVGSTVRVKMKHWKSSFCH